MFISQQNLHLRASTPTEACLSLYLESQMLSCFSTSAQSRLPPTPGLLHLLLLRLQSTSVSAKNRVELGIQDVAHDEVEDVFTIVALKTYHRE